ncbi:fibrobacter succinogenes major paralogous domain-containing protein [bacterium]|nr:fibrobacter succinogenes major paralogous domain-containing protein [bacterium]
MKKILLLCGLVCSLGANAQSWPWNPDFDTDGVIGTVDLLALLAVYNTEFEAQLLVTDSSSALIYVGDMDLWDCAGTCSALEGNWKVMDEKILGNFKEDIIGWTENTNLTWLDPRAIVGINALQPSSGWQETVQPLNTEASCVCQTRVANPVNMPLIECEFVDICGVCEGPGPIYSCGCEEMPEWACDCDGNQLDVLGVCGGGCLGDYDGDGVCDEYVPGACNNLDTWEYYDYTYDLVEIGGRCWFKQDLRTEFYANGDSISNPTSIAEWADVANNYEGAWDALEGYEYNGSVYNWYATVDERQLCPTGWSVPGHTEYTSLIDSLIPLVEGSYLYIGAITNALLDEEISGGENWTGYSATPTAYRSSNGTQFTASTACSYWTSSYSGNGESWYFYLSLNNLQATSTIEATYSQMLLDAPRASGYAIRCVKNQ